MGHARSKHKVEVIDRDFNATALAGPHLEVVHLDFEQANRACLKLNRQIE